MSENIIPSSTEALFQEYVIPTYGRFPLVLERGDGCRVWDDQGDSYLDFGAGIAVSSVGHAHPRVIRALQEQASRLIHTSNLYYTRPQGELARSLVSKVGIPGKVFFGNSGAEANDGLYKLARKYGNEGRPPEPRHSTGEPIEYAPQRYEIITFQGSFHGRTLGGIAATGQEKVRKGFDPIMPGFRHVPFNDAPAVLAAITPQTAAILLEPIQGEIGVLAATPAFLKTLRSICDDHGLLLMFDEIQCGLGRTGDWCGWKSIVGDEVIPDAVSWAKGMAGGVPIGAFWVRDREIALKSGETVSLANLLGPGSHGSTFGGTPLACAVANEVLSIIEEEGLLARAAELGTYAREAIARLGSPKVAEVRGIGLMIAIVLAPGENDAAQPPAAGLIARLHEVGLLAIPSGTHAVRWLPPLNVTREEIDQAVDLLAKALE
ncbi:MAG TPA: aspartate aminotransferase family protein [Chthoniobacteraceae bacterium]|nr:aspartate aminotransferase family protein [Chthoniobacteraceae bacterium]